MTNEPFHDGEIAVQERAGERDIARRHGAGIAPHIVGGALAFLAHQRLLAVTIAGHDSHLWTSVWCGEPGFIQSSDGRRVDIRIASMESSADDPVLARLSAGGQLGMLAIDLFSRRRLRVSGSIEAVSADQIGVRVCQSVGNCPKYIHRREHHDHSLALSAGRPREEGLLIDDRRRVLVERADTAFVGSIHQTGGADASHRGGAPGFINVVDAKTLRVPDYPGNSMFMTLGNFEVDSRASLAVPDFSRARVLCLSGSAHLHFAEERSAHPTGGTGRYWDFSVREWVEFDLPSLKTWQSIQTSPSDAIGAQK